MRFLLDQDVYASTVRFLRDLGHDVLPVAQIGLSQAGEEELLRIAQEQSRIFVTRDRDFGLRRHWVRGSVSANAPLDPERCPRRARKSTEDPY